MGSALYSAKLLLAATGISVGTLHLPLTWDGSYHVGPYILQAWYEIKTQQSTAIHMMP